MLSYSRLVRQKALEHSALLIVPKDTQLLREVLTGLELYGDAPK